MVVLSALPVRLLIDDIQASYINMDHVDCKRGNPVSALGVGGKNNCSPHLEVAFKPCVSGDLQKQNKKIKK